MANFKLLIVPFVLAFSSLSWAGYAMVAPPPTWTAGTSVLGGGNAGGFYAAAANDASFANGVRGASAVLNVGGRSITMPVAYRFAANAPRVAAVFAYANPALLIGVAAIAAYAYYQTGGFKVVDGKWMKEVAGVECSSNCYEYKIPNTTYWGSKQSVCSAWASGYAGMSGSVVGDHCDMMYGAILNATTYFESRSIPPYNTGSLRPATPEEFEETMAPLPLPDGVPQLLPVPLPVEIPILNPTPEPVPKPAIVPVPTPQPLRVPQGEPQPVPNTDPQKYKTPVIDVTPIPSTPWKVDVVPKEIIKEDATPLPDTAPVPQTPASGTSETPTVPDLCEKNPEILACQKLDTPDSDSLEGKDKEVSVTPDSGWGADNASCPAPKHITVQGRDIPIPYDLFCQYMSGIRPLVIAMAWLSAGFILLGVKGGD